jgi:adenylate cyclase
LGRRGELTPERQTMIEHFAEGLAAYRRRAWDEGRTAFTAALAAVPGDGPSKVFLARLTQLEAEPPPADWDGVWALSEK